MSEKNIAPPQQKSDLLQIGAIFRKKREELTYTLEHVSEITRISLTSLRNIEEGNLNALPGLVFVRGFVRNYAKLLGLESDWMIEALNQTYSNQNQSSPLLDQDRDFVSQSQEENRNPKGRYLTGSLVIIVFVIIILFWQSKSLIQQVNLKKGVETVQAIDPVASSQDTIEPEIQKPTEAPPIPEKKQEISPLTLTLVAMDNDWIHLAIDDQEPFDLRLKKGEKYDWPAQEGYSLVMTTGNTAFIHLNGEEIVERENFKDELYQVKLNKFTLTRINNR
ncbi:MAG: helix-turn-helix domain-containing protein [SAR324 cluster bacterium]|nr:helix-turn-helix domain-containing protein [SAR324 cluster bacterium]